MITSARLRPNISTLQPGLAECAKLLKSNDTHIRSDRQTDGHTCITKPDGPTCQARHIRHKQCGKQFENQLARN